MKVKFPTSLGLYAYIFLLVVVSNKDTIDFVMGNHWYLLFTILLSILWIAGTIISEMEKDYLTDVINGLNRRVNYLENREKYRTADFFGLNKNKEENDHE